MRRAGDEAVADTVGARTIADGSRSGDHVPGFPPVVAAQPPLPLLRLAVRSGEDAFAHPAEVDFARILTYYRVPWAYEPTAFVLARAADGRPTQVFTPDFYLPDQRLYVELTTMRQRLVTRKNRKVRRLRELYPNVRIKLLYRRDYHRLLLSYRRPAPDPAPLRPCRPGAILFTEAAIRARVGELAETIAADLAASPRPGTPPPLLLGVGGGAEAFLGLLETGLAARGVACETDRLAVTRYRGSDGACRVRVRRGPRADPAGRRVLLVEDVVSTGLSLRYLIGWLRRRRAAEVLVCALLDRRAARLCDVPIRYAAFEAPNQVLVGFGLHLRRRFRELPYIALLEDGDGVEGGA